MVSGELTATLAAEQIASLGRADSNPGPATADDAGPRVPAEVRREVAARDGHRCTFVADDGTRCGATAWLEPPKPVQTAGPAPPD